MMRGLKYALISVVVSNGPVTAAAESLRAVPLEQFPGRPRLFSAGAVDSRAQRFYVYGGFQLDSASQSVPVFQDSDLWCYDIESMKWSGPFRDAMGPGPRHSHSLAVDPNNSNLFLIGGSSRSGRCRDSLWVMNPKAQVWSNVTSRDPYSVGVEDAPLVPGADGRVWYGFGKCASPTSTFGEPLFSRTPESTAWQQEPITGEIPPRSAHVMAFDSRRGQILLYGGLPRGGSAVLIPPADTRSHNRLEDASSNSSGPTIEVWGYAPEASRWTRLSAAGVGLRQERSWAIGAYSPSSDALLVYGGTQTGIFHPEWYDSPGKVYGSLAIFDLGTRSWTEIPIEGEGAKRTQAAGGYCACTGTMFAIGGVDTSLYSQQRPPMLSAPIAIQVETIARAKWQGAKGKSGRVFGKVALLELPVTDAQPYDVRLIDCATGRQLGLFGDVKRVGRSRFRVKVTELTVGPRLDESVVRIVGKLRDHPIGFIATAAWGRSRENEGADTELGDNDSGNLMNAPTRAQGREQEEPVAVRFGGTSFMFSEEAIASSSGEIGITLFDLRGRRIASGKSSIGKSGLSIEIDRAFAHKHRGIFFARVEVGGVQKSRKVMLLSD